MREIKFRGWDEKEKRMYSSKELADLAGLWFEQSEDGSLEISLIEDSYGCRRQFKKMQYTGLKDKNGVEIYEGDIVMVTYEEDDIVETSYIGEVEFGDCCLSYTSEAPQHGSMGFYLKTEIEDEPQIGLFQDHNLIDGAAYNEVIGNIFEGVDKLR